MKSFISSLTQAERYITPEKVKRSAAAVNSTDASTAVRDAAVEDKYLALFANGDLTTVDVAAALNTRTCNILRPLNRLVARGLLWRVGTEKSAGSMPTVVWSITPQGEYLRTSKARFCNALAKSDKDTQRIAKMCNVTYYTALARLKCMEDEGVVSRVGVNRSVANKPSIIWHLKDIDAK